MGNSGSSPSTDKSAFSLDSALGKYYVSVFQKYKVLQLGQQPGEVKGGCDCMITGAADLQDYESSIYSKGKEKLIRDIARDTYAMLKGKAGGIDFDKSPIEKVVDALSKLLPNPKRKGTGIVANTKAHTDLTAALTAAINSTYKSQLIDPASDVTLQLNKAAEIIHSLVRDINTEFMTVAGDIERSVRNLKTLREYLRATHDRIMEIVGRSGDSTIQQESSSVDAFYQQLLGEVDRQLTILANTVSGTIGPTRESLIALLEDNDDFKGFVEKIKVSVGTTEFGSQLGYLLAGVDVLAQVSARVNKALKAVGMTIPEYKNTSNMQQLRSKLYDHMSKGKSPLTSAELAKFVAATEIIMSNNYAHDQIAEHLSKKGGEIYGAYEAAGGAVVDDSSDMFGAKFSSERSLGKRMEKQDMFRKRLFADFHDNLLTAYRRIVAAVNSLGPKIGRSIPITDDLERFIRAFSEVEMADRENFHVVLTGWQKDVQSRDWKNRFMMSLDAVHHHLSVLRGSSGKGSSDLGDIDKAITELKRLVTEFNDKFLSAISDVAPPHIPRVKGSGEGDDAAALEEKHASVDVKSQPDSPTGTSSWFSRFDELKQRALANPGVQKAMQRVQEVGNQVVDKAGQMVDEHSAAATAALQNVVQQYGGGMHDDSSDYYASIKTAQRKLFYYYRIATISGDLARSGEDMKEFGTGYETLLGESMARLIDKFEQEHKTAIEGLDSVAATAGSVGAAFKAFIDEAGISKEAKLAREKQVREWTEMLTAFYTDRRNAQRNLVKAAQAVDLYLKSFARAQALHPDEVRDLAALFDTMQTTAKWFSERSGNNIAALFEAFPSELVADGEFYSGDTTEYSASSSEHYYEYVAKNAAAGRLPGNPYYGRLLMNKKDYEGFMKLITKAVGGVRALENLVSAFVNAGSKFTGKALEKDSFMNQGQLIKTLMDYWCISTISMGTNDDTKISADIGYEKYPDNAAGHQYKGLGITQDDLNAGDDRKNLIAKVADQYPYMDVKEAVLDPADGITFTKSAAPISAVTGFRNDIGKTASLLHIRKKICVAMTKCDNESVFANRYSDTNALFLMIIKAMAAKILVLTETYALFHRPSAEQHLSLSPFRMILGGKSAAGGALDDVEIIDDAAELYVRLPLLGEWYRQALSFPEIKSETSKRDFVVSIVPDATSVYSDFLMIIFDRTDFVKEGAYSEGDIRALIKAINKIVIAHKDRDPAVTIRNVIHGLVVEVNRRYGFVKREDMDKYYENRRKMYNPEDGDINEVDRVDYDILDSKNSWSARPAPSDQFVAFRSFDPKVQQVWTKEVKEIVESFRTKIMGDFSSLESAETPSSTGSSTYAPNKLKYSFDEAIRNTRAAVKGSKSHADKFQTIMRAIQGLSKFGGFRMEHALMFQEMVVFPLTALYSIWRVLSEFNTLVQATDLSFYGNNKVEKKAYPDDGKGTDEKKKAYRVNSLADAYVAAKQKESKDLGVTDKYMYDDNFKDEVKKYLNDGDNTDVNIKTSIKSNIALNVLLRSCYSVGVDLGKMCEFNFSSDGKVLLDVSQLREHVTRVLSALKYTINIFRNIYGRGFVELFEVASKVGAKDDVRPTYYDMEEHLLEILLKDRDKCGLPRASEILTKTFKFINTNIDPAEATDAILAKLSYWNVDGVALSLSGNQRDDGSNGNKFPFDLIPTFDNGYGGLARNEEEKVIIRSLAEADIKMQSIRKEAKDANDAKAADDAKVALGAAADAAIINAAAAANAALAKAEREQQVTMDRYKLKGTYTSSVCDATFDDETKLPDLEESGLLVRFNALVARYLSLFYDSAGRKFYTPLIGGFARSQSSAVMNGKAIADMNLDGATARGLPPSGIILFASNARAMRNILSATNPQTNIKLYATDKLTDLADYMIETMRGNLPHFARYFAEVRQMAEYLKRVVMDGSLNMKHGIGNDGITDEKPGFSVADVKDDAEVDSNLRKQWYQELYDNIIAAVNSMMGCVTSVYKELVDVPLYFEVYQNSIAEYRNQNGRLPLMPVNYMLAPLSKGWKYDTASLLQPVHRPGSEGFKFNYGTRRLLTDARDPFKLSYAPGLDAAVDAFNGISSLDLKLEKGFVEQQMRDLLSLVQWLLAGRTSKYWLGGNAIDESKSDYKGHKAGEPKYHVYPLSVTTNALLNTIESGDIRRNADIVLAPSVPGALPDMKDSDRQHWRVYNILDMNIVPINIHALMRDIPLINLINYSYSFSEMIDRFMRKKWRGRSGYGNNVDFEKVPPINESIYPEDLISRLVKDPYTKMDGRDYYTLLQRAILGDTGMPARRPKFLSDQLWNKVLLNEQYSWEGDRKLASYGVYTYDKGADVDENKARESDKKGWLVDVQGPTADSVISHNKNVSVSAATSILPSHRHGVSKDKITYPAFNKDTNRDVAKAAEVKSDRDAGFDGATKKILLIQGRLRADTTLIRNMMLVTWSQHITRLMVVDRLEKIHSPVVEGTQLIDDRFDQYRGADQFDGDMYV